MVQQQVDIVPPPAGSCPGYRAGCSPSGPAESSRLELTAAGVVAHPNTSRQQLPTRTRQPAASQLSTSRIPSNKQHACGTQQRCSTCTQCTSNPANCTNLLRHTDRASRPCEAAGILATCNQAWQPCAGASSKAFNVCCCVLLRAAIRCCCVLQEPTGTWRSSMECCRRLTASSSATGTSTAATRL